MTQDTIASKIGRPPKFSTPLELAQVADEYFAKCDKEDYIINTRKAAGSSQTAKNGSDIKADEMEIRVKYPYTLDGFADFANIGNWRQWRKDHGEDPGFRTVIDAIETRIRERQVVGAMVGAYKENLVSRLNGIAEKFDTNINTEQKQSAEEALAILKGQK